MKHTVSILLVLCLLLGGCAAPATAPAASTPAASAPEASTPAASTPAASAPEASTAQASAPEGFWLDPGIEGNLPAEAPRLQDNFHAAVNYDWIKSTSIPDGEARFGNFHHLDRENRRKIKELLAAPAADSADEQLAAGLYASALNWEARDKAGLGVLQKDYEAILAVSDLASLTELLAGNPQAATYASLLRIYVTVDDKDSSTKICYLAPSSLSLQDAAEYREMTPQGKLIKSADDTYYTTLLTHFGMSEADAAQLLSELLDFETKLAAGIYDRAVSYDPDYINLVYNPRTLAQLQEAAPAFPLDGMLEGQGVRYDGKYILMEPEWLAKLNELYTEENVPGFRAYLATSFLDHVASYCDSVCVRAKDRWDNDRYGTVGAHSDEDKAYTLCNNLMGDLLGRIYVTHYFDEASKADVTDIMQDVIAQFGVRLEGAQWLSDETRATAIEKLRTMSLRVGYPEAYYPWEKLSFDKDAPLIDRYAGITDFFNQIYAAELGQPVNRELWSMPAHEVNAFYHPNENSINFPAGILQDVFYDKDASRSRNLGAIGVVVGHEITHAFDSTGSQYDKDGNLNNWWIEADRAAFTERTSKVEAYFDSIEVVDGKHIHGDLTLGEAVADLGGMRCALDLVKKLDAPDYDGFFRAFATLWGERLTKEKRVNLIDTDPHPPAYLRSNVTMQQFEEFYDTYDVKEGDGMYLPPEKRLSVW